MEKTFAIGQEVTMLDKLSNGDFGTKKYELIQGEVDGLSRVKALRDFGSVRAGDVGGLVSGEHNLSQDGSAWVSDDAQVYDDAEVSGDAVVAGKARVFENAHVSGHAIVGENAQVFGAARVVGNARVKGDQVVNGGRLEGSRVGVVIAPQIRP